MPTPDPRAPAPGSPDPDLIIGDWDGSKTQALAYRSLVTNLRVMHTRYAALRAQWAASNDEHAASRAVAYQSMVMDLNRLITDAERVASGLI